MAGHSVKKEVLFGEHTIHLVSCASEDVHKRMLLILTIDDKGWDIIFRVSDLKQKTHTLTHNINTAVQLYNEI
jgi:hypothetical protein